MIAANIVMAMAPSMNRVVAAFLLFGLRNAGTPLAIASMPVRAVVPEENARATRKPRARPVNVLSGTIVQLALSATSASPCAIRQSAKNSIPKIPTMKP